MDVSEKRGSLFLTPQQYFKERGGRPRKRFGQNFLSQSATARRIVESAALSSHDIVVEIGPGLGALTQFVMPPAVEALHLVELDRDLAAYLLGVFHQAGCEELQAQVHVQDVMDFNFLELSRAVGSRLILLGNLPYNITSPLMFRILESRSAVDRAVFMIQREVGERFSAAPGTKEYGVLSVLLGIYARVTPLFVVGPGQFYPPPKVDSLVVRIDFNPASREDKRFSFVREMVSHVFQKRRKTVHNALKGFAEMGGDLLSEALAAAGINPQRRPETLQPAEYLNLAGFLREAAL